MHCGHEQRDVYRVPMRYLAWAYAVAKGLTGTDRHARDQLLRAAQSIPLHIAEGNGKGANADRRRFFEIARGSALDCAAIQDGLAACTAMTVADHAQGKAMSTRIVSMLTKLEQRSLDVREDPIAYGDFDYDNDNDSDKDSG